MFDGFDELVIDVHDASILTRTGGAGGFPVLLLHCHPRTSATWHRVAPLLVAAGHSVVCPDLRGYGRSRGPAPTPERFFGTIREDLLQALPGYKGPDIHSRGESPEADAFFYIDELETIIREWVAVVYHHRPHSKPRRLSRTEPTNVARSDVRARMARLGYNEAPRDPDLAFEFLKPKWRKILHYGVEIDGRLVRDLEVDLAVVRDHLFDEGVRRAVRRRRALVRRASAVLESAPRSRGRGCCGGGRVLLQEV